MVGTSTVKTEFLPVSLKSVAPVLLVKDKEKLHLVEDLTKMGYKGLILEPWALKSEAMVQEFQAQRSNEWEGTIRKDPEHWTANLWAEVYNFRKEGRMCAGRTGMWIDGKFKTSINPKDGHAVSDCIDPREKRVLEFIIPILYPEKLGRVTKEIGNTVFGALSREYKMSWRQVIHEVVDKLISMLGKRKPTPVSPYLFHFYSLLEYLRKEEMQQVEVARECLELGVAPEVEPKVVEVDSNRGSLSPNTRQQIPKPSSRSRMKTTFRSPKGKSPVWNLDWKDMSSLDLDNDPFKRVQNKLDQVQSRYSKMELVLKGATKLLGDCKTGNITKEIRKLKEEDNSELKTHNTHLKLQISDLQVTVKAQDKEIRRLKAKTKEIKQIQEFISHTGDIVTKAHLFNNEVKTEDHLSAQKIITVLMKYRHKMEATLVEMRKLLPGPSIPRTSQLPTQAAIPPSPKGKAQQMLDDLKGHLQERKVQEAVAAATKIVVPTPKVSPAVVPEATPKGKSKEKELESQAASSEPASQKSGKKKAKVPLPEVEDLEEEEESTTEDNNESDKKELPSTPLLDQKTRRSMNTRSTDRKKP